MCIYIEREDIGNADGEEGVNQYQMMEDLLSTRRELQSTMQVLYEATYAQGGQQVHSSAQGLCFRHTSCPWSNCGWGLRLDDAQEKEPATT